MSASFAFNVNMVLSTAALFACVLRCLSTLNISFSIKFFSSSMFVNGFMGVL